MKKVTILAVLAIGMMACNNNATPTGSTETATTAVTGEPQAQDEMPPVGGDRDEHGCIGSAGQSWSVLLQDCVQVFEVGQRLDPIEVKGGEAVISAFVVTKEGDDTQVELFITSEEMNPILKQEKDGIYKNSKYSYDAKKQELSVDGKVAYKKAM